MGIKYHVSCTSSLENYIPGLGSRRQDPRRALSVAVTTMFLLLIGPMLSRVLLKIVRGAQLNYHTW